MNAMETLGSWKVEIEYSRELRRLLVSQVIWIVCVTLTLQLRSFLSFERLFVLWYFGFIVTVHLFAPADSTSRWWRGVQVVVLSGFFGLCYFVARRAMVVV